MTDVKVDRSISVKEKDLLNNPEQIKKLEI